MGLMDWLAAALPDGKMDRPPTVSLGENTVTCSWPGGTEQTVSWADLRSVAIETADTGPYREDVFFLLSDSAGTCIVPQGAKGAAALVQRMQTLPGFDHDAFVAAMASTKNQRFVCWQRAEDSSG